MDFFNFLGKSAKDFAGGVGDVFKTAGETGFNFLVKPTIDTAQSVGRNIGTNLAAPTVISQHEQAVQAQTKQLDQLGALLKSGKLSKEQYKKAALDITQGSNTQDLQQIQAEGDPVRTAGIAGNAALTLATLGKIPNITKNPLVSNLAAGAGIGAGFGAAGTLQEQGQRTNIGDLLVNTAAGAGLGAATGAGGYLVPRAISGIKKGKPLQDIKKDIVDPVQAFHAGSGPEFSKQLSQASNIQEVKNILKSRVSPDVIDKIAPSIALAKDPNVISNILKKNTPDITFVPIDKLKSYEGAPDKARVDYYKKQIGSEGITPPLKVKPDSTGAFGIEDGKHRFQAYKELGYKKVPVEADSLSSIVASRPLSGAALQSSLSKNADDIPLSQRGGARPENALQTQFETALNSGDVKGAQAAIDQLPTPDLKAPLQSILDKTKPQSITEATVPKAAPVEPLDEITNALNGQPAAKGQTSAKGIATISAENRKALSKERGQRFAASEAAGKAAEGSQGYFAELKQLKGEYTKTKLGGMIENVGPQRAEELFNAARQKIQAVPDQLYDDLGYFPKSARLNTQTAIRKVIFGEGGGVPTASELKLIRVINPKLADNIESKIPKSRKLFDLASQLAGIPRALQSSFDLSMGGRQGLLVAARHPVIWGRANKESIKYLKSSKYFEKEMSTIRKTPEYSLGEKYGLATPAANKGAEEAYASAQLAEKIPILGKGIEASQRAYDGGLTKLRSDLWNKTLRAYGGADQVEQKLGAKGMQDLAEAINTLTGRGGKKGGFVSKHVNTLSETLFAPRLWAARLNTLRPEYYARLSPAARKVALENAGAFAAVAGVVLGAASALGGQVETDPRSSDFLKIKFGDTRYDIFGGLQQNIVFAWREITGEKKSTQTGETTKFAKNLADIVTGKTNEEAGVDDGFGKANRLTIAADLVTNKLAPLPAGIITQLEGKDRGGNEINPLAEIAKLFVPINVTGIYETSQATGSVASGAALNIPSFFGIGTQTYGVPSISLSDKQKATVKQLQDNGAPPQQVEAVTRFYQTQKTAPDRNKASGEINKALAAGDQDKAIQIAKDYNSKYASTFKKWTEKYDAYATDKDLLKEYTSGKIKLTAGSINQRLKNIKKNPQYAGE